MSYNSRVVVLEEARSVWPVHRSPRTFEEALLPAVVFRNASQRSGRATARVWAFAASAVDGKSKRIAICDEKGQVFVCDMGSSSYVQIRRASSGVRTMAWVHGKLVLGTMKGLFLSDTNGNYKETMVALPPSLNISPDAMPRHRNTLATDAAQHRLLYVVGNSVLLFHHDPLENTLLCVRHIDCGSTVLQAKFVTDCNDIAILAENAAVHVYDAETGVHLCNIESPPNEPNYRLTHFAISYDGTLAVCCTATAGLLVWTLQDKSYSLTRICDLPITVQSVSACAFIPGTHVCVVAADDQCLYAIEVTTYSAAIVFHWDLHVVQLSVEPQSRYMSCTVANGDVSVFTLDTIAHYYGQREKAGIVLRSRLPAQLRGAPGAAEFVVSNHVPMQTPQPATRTPVLRNQEVEDEPFTVEHQQTPMAVRFNLDQTACTDEEGDFASATASHSATIYRSSDVRASSMAATPKARTPLFRLTKLTPKERRVNHRKLREYLQRNLCFPAAHRRLIWRFLLKLPENQEAYVALLSQGVHPTCQDLDLQFPLTNRRLAEKLKTMCSSLAHWSPICGEVWYIPALAFPFLIVYGTDDLAAFETVVTLLMWWGVSWQASFPDPPAHVLLLLSELLQYHDPGLASHLQRHEVSSAQWGWPLLCTMFTEVLEKDDWLCLLDNLFTQIHDRAILYAAAVTVPITFRATLLKAETGEDIISSLRRQQPLHISTFISNLESLRRSTPSGLLPARNRDSQLPGVMQELFDQRLGVFPLPEGTYPAFDGYPKAVVDYQIKAREKILAEEQDTRRHEKLLSKLKHEAEEVQRQFREYINRKEAAKQQRSEQAKQQLELQADQLETLQRLEEQVLDQRQENLKALQQILDERLKYREAYEGDSKELQQQELEYFVRRLQWMLQSRQRDEALAVMEATLYEELHQLEQEAGSADAMESMAEQMRTAHRDLAQRAQSEQIRWRQEIENFKSELKRGRGNNKAPKLDDVHDIRGIIQSIQELQQGIEFDDGSVEEDGDDHQRTNAVPRPKIEIKNVAAGSSPKERLHRSQNSSATASKSESGEPQQPMFRQSPLAPSQRALSADQQRPARFRMQPVDIMTDSSSHSSSHCSSHARKAASTTFQPTAAGMSRSGAFSVSSAATSASSSRSGSHPAAPRFTTSQIRSLVRDVLGSEYSTSHGSVVMSPDRIDLTTSSGTPASSGNSSIGVR